jgi:hypothetical protein
MAPEMTAPQGSVVLASFENRRTAERMLASLGRDFRKTARAGSLDALVVSANADGSLKLTQSRFLTAGDLTAMLMRVSLSWTVGFLGLFGMFKGGKRGEHAVHERAVHVGSGEHQAHAILEKAGPHAAIVLVRCEDEETARAIRTQAADRAIDTWAGSLEEFVAELDPGSEHDWVRTALGSPASG